MTVRSELLTATDETIDDAVRHADPMVLRGLLYQLTGDESIAANSSHSRQPMARSGQACRRQTAAKSSATT